MRVSFIYFGECGIELAAAIIVVVAAKLLVNSPTLKLVCFTFTFLLFFLYCYLPIIGGLIIIVLSMLSKRGREEIFI